MSLHPDVAQRHLKIVHALKLATPGIRRTEAGYIAKVLVNATDLSDPLKTNMEEILVGDWNQARDAFSALVCDNNETPIEFKSEAEAMDQSRQLGDSLVKRYAYGLYAAHGITVDPQEQAGATLHFFRNGRP